MLLDRLAVWWLARQGYFAELPNAGVVLRIELRRRARPLPRWLRVTLQSVFGVLVVLASVGYCYRYSLLGTAPGP